MASDAPGRPAAHQPTIEFRLLGAYTIAVDGVLLPPLPTEKSRLLLASLLLHPTPQPRSRLAALAWPDLPEARARRRLTQELWRINSALEKAGAPPLLAAAGDAVGIDPVANVQCDVAQLRATLARLQHAEAAAWPTLAELTALYRGELLPGHYDDWALLAREQIFQSFTAGLARLLAEHKRRGDWEAAEQVVQTLLEHDPYTETWVMEAMRIAQAQHRPALGRRHYEHFAALLRAEQGGAPSPELTALAQQLAAAPAPEAAAASAAPVAFLDPHYQPPLLGRTAERALLLRALTHAQNGRGQICLVEGAAGVGKSHLLATLAADARWRRLAVGWGAGQEIRRNESYHPLLQALGNLLSPLRGQQLQATLDPIWLTTAAELLPPLAAALPNLPPPPPLDREPARVRTLEALTRLLLALARLTPTVLVIDDLQWADSATLDLLIYLARRVADSPLLLLLSYRSEEVRAQAAIWHALAEIDRGAQPQRVELAGIAAEECAALVRILLDLPHPAPAFEGRIYAQTQGNPFFVLETLRTLSQEGNLTRSAGGGWQTPWDEQTVDYREAAIPAQVDALIRRRLAQLAGDERSVLDVAAVLATPFDLTLLAAFFPDSLAQLLVALATLVQRRFLRETPTAYQFEHDQIRQTVYTQLDLAARQALHQRAGEILARLQPDAHALLAHHFEQAGAVGRAFHYHVKAGDAALRQGSYRLARPHYARAVGWLDALHLATPARVAVLTAWERLLGFLGERSLQGEVLEALAQVPGLDARQQAILTLRRARCEGDASHFDGAVELAAASLAVAETLDEGHLRAEALLVWGELLHQRGDAAAATARLQEAVAAAAATGDLALEAAAWIALADALPARNAYAEAAAAAEAALTRFRALGDLAGEARANLALAVISVEQGDVAGGAERYAQALALTEQCGYRFQEARIAANLANALCILGRIGDALASYERGIAIGRELGDERLEHLIAINHASTWFSFVGPNAEVAAQVRRALAWSEAAGDDLGVGQAWNILAMDAAYRDDLAEARAHLDRSIAAFERVDYAYVKAQALRAQAQLCQVEGNQPAALALIRRALAVSREIAADHLTYEMRSIEGEILLALGELDAALAAVSEAASHAGPDIFQSYLLHHRHSLALLALGREAEARASLAVAYAELSALLDGLTPEQRARSRTAIPAHRALLADASRLLGVQQKDF